jgi:hypothetical protein
MLAAFAPIARASSRASIAHPALLIAALVLWSVVVLLRTDRDRRLRLAAIATCGFLIRFMQLI